MKSRCDHLIVARWPFTLIPSSVCGTDILDPRSLVYLNFYFSETWILRTADRRRVGDFEMCWRISHGRVSVPVHLYFRRLNHNDSPVLCTPRYCLFLAAIQQDVMTWGNYWYKQAGKETWPEAFANPLDWYILKASAWRANTTRTTVNRESWSLVRRVIEIIDTHILEDVNITMMNFEPKRK